MQIIEKNIGELKPYENNPRKNEDAVEYVANSIREFGWQVPIVIDKDNTIVAGHTRYLAAELLEIDVIPCVVADDLSEEQIRAFRIVDNKVAEKAGWDYNLLEDELSELKIDMALFGFEDGKSVMEDITLDDSLFEDAGKEYECPKCHKSFIVRDGEVEMC